MLQCWYVQSFYSTRQIGRYAASNVVVAEISDSIAEKKKWADKLFRIMNNDNSRKVGTHPTHW